MAARKTPCIYTRLTPRLLVSLKYFAKQRGLSVSTACRMILMQYFEGKKIGE